MAAITKLGVAGLLPFKRRAIIPSTWGVMAVRHHWNKDFKPGKMPKTEAERLAAAKKYNLIPQDYETYPDDAPTRYEDYPKLAPVSGDARSDFYPWDIPAQKRNFGEPMHPDSDFIGEDKYDINMRPRFPGWVQALTFLGVMSSTFALYWWLNDYKHYHPVTRKQYPKEGSKHYTFEIDG